MNVRLKRARELAGYAVQLTKDEGLPTMLKRGAGFVKRRCFGKRARYLPAKKVLEAQKAEMAGKTAADCGLPTISILTPLYNTPENTCGNFWIPLRTRRPPTVSSALRMLPMQNMPM